MNGPSPIRWSSKPALIAPVVLNAAFGSGRNAAWPSCDSKVDVRRRERHWNSLVPSTLRPLSFVAVGVPFGVGRLQRGIAGDLRVVVVVALPVGRRARRSSTRRYSVCAVTGSPL